MTNILDDIIPRFGQSLEAEDRYIIGGTQLRNQFGGVLQLPSERYYQFICWRAAISRWTATVETAIEGCQVDLALIADGRRSAVEMKLWMSGSGETELPGIRSDIGRLTRLNVSNGCMVLFSANPPSMTHENFEWLGEQIPELADAPMRYYSFPTHNPRGDVMEFWVAGWLVKTPETVEAVIHTRPLTKSSEHL